MWIAIVLVTYVVTWPHIALVYTEDAVLSQLIVFVQPSSAPAKRALTHKATADSYVVVMQSVCMQSFFLLIGHIVGVGDEKSTETRGYLGWRGFCILAHSWIQWKALKCKPSARRALYGLGRCGNLCACPVLPGRLAKWGRAQLERRSGPGP